MKFLKLAVLAMLFFSASVFAQQQFFVTADRNVSVYANQVRQMNERAVATIDRGQQARVIETRGNQYRVRLDGGAEGWIESRFVTRATGRAFTFDDVTVEGFVDLSTPLIITDVEDGTSISIELDRSFADALRRSSSKERHMRSTR